MSPKLRLLRPADFGLGIRLSGLGTALGEQRVTNEALHAAGAPLTPDEMVRLSGITARRYADPGTATSDLALAAARQALSTAGVAPTDIDRLVLATVSPDHPSPSTACLVQHALGLRQVPAMDVSAACTGFLYAMDIAARALLTGDEHTLVIAADIRSRFLNPQDRATCALFGDGAGAAVLSRGPVGQGLLALGVLADGRGARSVLVPAGGSREPASAETVAARRHTIHMESGPQVYLTAVEGMLGTAESLLQQMNLAMADIDLIIPHQPNRRILDRMARLAGVPADRIYINIEELGNLSAASCVVALEGALREGRLRPGQLALSLAAGAGYTAGAALWQF